MVLGCGNKITFWGVSLPIIGKMNEAVGPQLGEEEILSTDGEAVA